MLEREETVRNKFVAKLLGKATPGQLVAVRAAISSYLTTYGYSSVERYIREEVLEAFDSENYEHPGIARFVSDRDLAVALNNHPFRISRYGGIKTGPMQKIGRDDTGSWIED